MDFPEDLGYTSDHEWVKEGNDLIARVGITSFAANEMGDIVFVSLPDVGTDVSVDDSVAELESTKSVAEVLCPVSGVIVAVNEQLSDSPELVGQDPYGDGWLFSVSMAQPSELDELLDSITYAAQVE